MKVSYVVDKIMTFLLIISFFSLIFTVSLQIFGRFFLPQAASWTEEIARFIMIYIVALGVGKAAASNSLIKVDVIDHLLSPPILLLRDIVYKIISIAFLAISSYYAFILTYNGIKQFAASIHLQMSYIFFSMILMNLSVLVIYLYEVLKGFYKLINKGEKTV